MWLRLDINSFTVNFLLHIIHTEKIVSAKQEEMHKRNLRKKNLTREFENIRHGISCSYFIIIIFICFLKFVVSPSEKAADYI